MAGVCPWFSALCKVGCLSSMLNPAQLVPGEVDYGRRKTEEVPCLVLYTDCTVWYLSMFFPGSSRASILLLLPLHSTTVGSSLCLLAHPPPSLTSTATDTQSGLHLPARSALPHQSVAVTTHHTSHITPHTSSAFHLHLHFHLLSFPLPSLTSFSSFPLFGKILSLVHRFVALSSSASTS